MKSKILAIRGIALGWLSVVIAAGSVWIVLDDSGPAAWDQSRHARNALAMLDLLRDIGRDHTLFDFLFYYDFYPPFSYLPTVLFHLVFGRTYDVACFSTLLFWIPLLFAATVASGRRLLGERAGWFSGFVVLSFASVVALSKDFLTDLQTAAMTALAVWGLLRSNLLLTPRNSRVVQVGLIVGACMLTKWTMPVFLLGALLVALVRGLRKNPARFFGNAILAGGVASLMALPWYYPNRRDIVHSLLFSVEYGNELGYPYPFSLSSFVWYARALVESHLSVLPTLVFLGGMAVLSRKRRSVFVLITMAIVFAYVIPTAMRNKEVRFAMAFLPYVSWGMAGLLVSAKLGLHRLAVGAVALSACAGLIGALFRIPYVPAKIGHGFMTVLNQEPFWWSKPPQSDLPDPAREAELAARSVWLCRPYAGPAGQAVVEVRVDHVRLDGYRFGYHALLNHGVVRSSARPDAPFFEKFGWPAAGPAGVDFVLVPGNNPLASSSEYKATAFVEIPDLPGARGVALLATQRSAAASRHSPPMGIFLDLEPGNAACLQSVTVSGPGGIEPRKVGFEMDWMIPSRGVGRRFEYIRRLQAMGPTPFRLEWIGPSTWEAGDQKRESVLLDVPESVKPGQYELNLSLLRRPKDHRKSPTPTQLIGVGVPAGTGDIPIGLIRLR